MKRHILSSFLSIFLGLVSCNGDLSHDEDDERFFSPDTTYSYTSMGYYAICDCWVTSPDQEGVQQIEKNNLYGFMDTLGNIILEPEYEATGWWSEGKGAVVKDGKWGYVDINGKMVIDFQFEYAGDFGSGLANVRNEDYMWGYIDHTGELVIPYKYDKAYAFYEGVAAIKHDDYWEFIDSTETVVIDQRFADVVISFDNDTAVVKFDEYGEYRYINHKGEDIGSVNYLNSDE